MTDRVDTHKLQRRHHFPALVLLSLRRLPHLYPHLWGVLVLIINEMVLVLVLDVAGQSSTSTALQAEYEYEYEYENTRTLRIARQKCG